jgi:drug/metabolite transporter (DMT)-like permease
VKNIFCDDFSLLCLFSVVLFKGFCSFTHLNNRPVIYLLLTIFLSTIIIITFKVMGLHKVNTLQAITFNYLFAAITGYFMMGQGITFPLLMAKPWFYYTFFTGAMFILTFFLFAQSSHKAGVSITAVSSKMSVILPVMAGFVWFQDTLSLYKVLGIALGLASFYFIFNTGHKIRFDYKYVLLPVLLLVGNGVNDTLVKYVQHNFLDGDEGLYIEVVFVIALLIGGFYLLGRIVSGKESLHLKSILFGIFLGAVNFFGAWFFLKSMGLFQASFLFPVVNVSVVVLSSLVGLTVFKEDLRRINLIGIVMAVVAIFLISVG